MWSRKGQRPLARARIDYTGAVHHGFRRYICNNTYSGSGSTGKRCPPGSVSADAVETVVWEAIKSTVQQPDIVVPETNDGSSVPATPILQRLSVNR